MKIGTCNIRGMNKIGKLQLIGRELERNDVAVCSLGETKCKQSGIFTTGDGHVVVMSGKENRSHHGVDVWVSKRCARAMKEFWLLDLRQNQ